MRSGFTKRLTNRIGEDLDFVKGWLAKPKAVGAIAPTSSGMARKMASIANPNSGLPVLELGPGTGVITKAILKQGFAAENLISVEFSSSFIPGLKRRYPGVNFVQGDAFDIDKIAAELGIEQFDCVISALPLLNFPVSQRVRLVAKALKLIAPGRPMVQFSYGLKSPAPARSRYYKVHHMDTVIRNLPPARIWTYTKPDS